MKGLSTTTIIIAVLVLLLLCCLCSVALGLATTALSWFRLEPQTGLVLPDPATPTPQIVRPTQTFVFEPVSDETLRILENTLVPENDLRELARRLEGKENVPLTVPPPNEPFEVGDEKTFWVTNVDTNENFRITARLRAVTDHLYFWIEEGVQYREGDLEELVQTFEEEIYPTNRSFFGEEWSPGVDGDPHIYMLLVRGVGASLAGYFSSADEYHPLAHEYSNAHEMFVLNADNLDLDEPFTLGVLAHEFQHMIHWYRDRNEETWMNEGFSELASFLNGYDVGGFDFLYVRDPDLQLTDWPNDPSATTPHYGASFLFLNYFLGRFGNEATQALVANPENGMVSVDEVLRSIDAVDPDTGVPIEADDVFADWILASYLQDPSIQDGRYSNELYPEAPRPGDTEEIDECPVDGLTREVRQYGVDYIRIDCEGTFTLQFEGSNQVGVLPADPHSGDYAFWSNKGDESDMTLTRTFDFRDQEGPLTLTYWTWYDIEEDYDYLYLEASLDGDTWEILETPSGTSEDPSGNSFGWGYNGLSGGGPRWIQEEVDLTPFAGEEVQIRLEYITDAAVNGEGFLLDDVAVPEIGYSTDFEDGDGGWAAEGWVRIQNLLPQTFRLALITFGDEVQIETLPMTAENTLEVPLQLEGPVDEAVLVVAGTTRFTRLPAAYRFSIHSLTE